MQIHELNDRDCAEILQRVQVGRLGCCRLDQPYIVPIYFSFDHEQRCLYAFSMVGQKIEWMRENPKVCVEVEEIAENNRWTTVLVYGRYQELERTGVDAATRSRAERLFQQRQEWWLPAAARVGSQQQDHAVIYAIRIDRMTGRRTTKPR